MCIAQTGCNTVTLYVHVALFAMSYHTNVSYCWTYKVRAEVASYEGPFSVAVVAFCCNQDRDSWTFSNSLSELSHVHSSYWFTVYGMFTSIYRDCSF